MIKYVDGDFGLVSPSVIFEITIRSIIISGSATIIATIWSIPIALILTVTNTKLSKTLIGIFNVFVGIPTVVIGLLVYLLLSRTGFFGWLGLLYTPIAIIIGEAILITPLIISISVELLKIDMGEIIELAKTYGASLLNTITTVFNEGGGRIFSASILGFQRAIGELAIALMVGGNIKGFTRVFTTAIALEIEKGEFDLAISLAIILLIIDLFIVALLRLMGWRK